MARFHFTVLPLGDGRDIAQARLEKLKQAITSLRVEPFRVALDTLDRNALVGKGNGGIRLLRKAVKRQLIAAGMPVADYDSKPHLSITYGAALERKLTVPVISWMVEDFQLIRSGDGRHEELGRWPLLSRQGAFAF